MLYVNIKTRLIIEPYLLKSDPFARNIFCKFRCGNSKLPVVVGKFEGIDYSGRLCQFCNSESLGDEFHYIFQCCCFTKERNLLLKSYFRRRPSVIKMKELFETQNRKTLANLIRFCKIIMEKFLR